MKSFCGVRKRLLIDLKPLKQFATKSLPADSTLRSIILSEPDQVTTLEFLARLDIFLKLARMEDSAKRRV